MICMDRMDKKLQIVCNGKFLSADEKIRLHFIDIFYHER